MNIFVTGSEVTHGGALKDNPSPINPVALEVIRLVLEYYSSGILDKTDLKELRSSLNGLIEKLPDDPEVFLN